METWQCVHTHTHTHTHTHYTHYTQGNQVKIVNHWTKKDIECSFDCNALQHKRW